MHIIIFWHWYQINTAMLTTAAHIAIKITVNYINKQSRYQSLAIILDEMICSCNTNFNIGQKHIGKINYAVDW